MTLLNPLLVAELNDLEVDELNGLLMDVGYSNAILSVIPIASFSPNQPLLLL